MTTKGWCPRCEEFPALPHECFTLGLKQILDWIMTEHMLNDTRKDIKPAVIILLTVSIGAIAGIIITGLI